MSMINGTRAKKTKNNIPSTGHGVGHIGHAYYHIDCEVATRDFRNPLDQGLAEILPTIRPPHRGTDEHFHGDGMFKKVPFQKEIRKPVNLAGGRQAAKEGFAPVIL